MRNLFSLLSSTELSSIILLASSYLTVPAAAALSFPPAPAANLDLSQLGRVALAGDFEAASLYQFTQETETVRNSNGSLSLLSRFPTGAFATLQSSDAYIKAMCPFVQSGKLLGVLIGGNFTSLGGVEAPGIALFLPDNSTVRPLPGLDGRVNALYCDQSAGIAYVGGQFTVGNSSNAIARTATGWKSLPFIGFNGPVTSITKAPNGSIVFGGSFDGLGNTTSPSLGDGQLINVGSANIQAGPSSVNGALNDPRNIVCKNAGVDGPGNTWLLADNTPGAWTATFKFGFNPTKLRLWNTNIDGRGTKTFRFTAIPINGIMNFSYVDPTGQQRFCDATCPMPQGNTTFQDFHFVNVIGMNGFRIDVSEWYGHGAGFSGLELFENDIYTFAINDFNEPQCVGNSAGASVATVGSWSTISSGASSSDFVAATLNGQNIDPARAQMTFQPDIKQAGNYSITMFTPGCLEDASCGTRGRVTITGQVAASGTNGAPAAFQTQIFQTNNFDKYDQIYAGHVDVASGAFKPALTLAASPGQNGPLTIVAQRVRFELISTTGGLNGLFEYNPNTTTVDMNFKKSTIDSAATNMDSGATVNSLVTQGNSIYVGGAYSAAGYSNFFSVSTPTVNPAFGGINGPVQAMYANGSAIFIGGSFSGTRDSGGPQGLLNLAVYVNSSNSWFPMGAGVNGTVQYIVPFQINLSSSKNTDLALGISGNFNQVLGFASYPSFSVQDFAIWVPSRGNWLQNLKIPTAFLKGILTATTAVPNNPPMFAGSVSSFDVGANGAVQLTGSGGTSLQAFPAVIRQPQTSAASNRKRDVQVTIPSGVITGLLYSQNNLNVTVLGGHFSSNGSNGTAINNLLVINGKNSDKVYGITSGVNNSSVFRTLGATGSSLFAGGSISGSVGGGDVSGMIVWDLGSMDFAKTQPIGLKGSNVVVNAIAPQPSTSMVFVGGSFDSAGSFDCPSLCVFDNSRQQWNNPGTGLGGNVTAMFWADDTHLLVAGSLTVNSTSTTVSTYDANGHFFSAASSVNAPNGIISSITPGNSNGSMVWVAGQANNGSAFLSKYNGRSWSSAGGFSPDSVISGLQIFTLTKNHVDSPLMDKAHSLLVMGKLILPNYGNVSAALFNGTTFTPYLLSSTPGSTPGTVYSAFVEKPQNFFKAGRKHLAAGFIVLIGLAVALGLIFLLVAGGMVAERVRRRRQGYVQAPTHPAHENLMRIPPEELLGSIGRTGGNQI